MAESWNSMFLGRAKELGQLERIWLEAKSGKPQLVVILAEPGLGKTRLVQAFYNLLTERYDESGEMGGNGYWPQNFGGTSRFSTDINPNMKNEERGPDSKIPWLWWGLRTRRIDPESRASPGTYCCLTDSISVLETHKHALGTLQSERRETIAEAWKKVGITAAKSAVGFIGMGGTIDLLEASVILGKAYRDPVDDRRPFHQEIRRYRESVADSAVKYLVAVMSEASKGGAALPVVLVIDDAQWLEEQTTVFVRDILDKSVKLGLPLMVVATHWEREWAENVNNREDCCLASLVDLDSLKPAIIKLEPVKALEPMLKTALPGLTGSQIALVVDKVGGNPQLMFEMIDFLKRNSYNFLKRDRNGPLTPKVESDIKNMRLNYHDLVERRLCALPEEVKDCLVWSSMQGVVFLKSLTVGISDRLSDGGVGGCEDPEHSVADGMEISKNLATVGYLQDAARIYALLNEKSPELMEFKQRVYCEVATKILPDDEAERVLQTLRCPVCQHSLRQIVERV